MSDEERHEHTDKINEEVPTSEEERHEYTVKINEELQKCADFALLDLILKLLLNTNSESAA